MIDFERIEGPRQSKAENFAELCNLLIIHEYESSNPKVVDGRGGDKGVDCFIGDFGGTLRVFQHKYFIGKLQAPQQRQIAHSLATACISNELTHWTLCIPKNLLPREQDWFQNTLLDKAAKIVHQMVRRTDSCLLKGKPHALAATQTDYWGESKLLGLLLKYPHVAKLFFPTTPRDTLGSPARLILDGLHVVWDYHSNAVFVSFSLVNTGGHVAVVDNLLMDILGSHPCDESEQPWIGAVLQEFRFCIALDPSRTTYPVGEDKTFVYRNGDIDGFKLKLTSARRWYYRAVIKVIWHDVEEGVSHTTVSNSFLARFPEV
ncbi:MAG: hypothetical protein Q8K00_19075 [Syntrophales bacterium]|nr:hypothetical protein [Syntrophales bacterium]